jgi:hypothetical protein
MDSEYRAYPSVIPLLVPGGPVAFLGISGSGIHFAELPRLTLSHRHSTVSPQHPLVGTDSTSHCVPSAVIILRPRDAHRRGHRFTAPHFHFVPSITFSLLEALEFSDRIVAGGFMEQFTRFASDRKSATSAWPHSTVVILHRERTFPSLSQSASLGRRSDCQITTYGTGIKSGLASRQIFPDLLVCISPILHTQIPPQRR